MMVNIAYNKSHYVERESVEGERLNIFLQHTCTYTREGLKLLLEELSNYDLIDEIFEVRDLENSTCRKLYNMNVDFFILGVQENKINLSEVLRFIIEWLPLFSPQAKVIIMIPKYSMGQLARYLLGVKNVCAVLDNGSSLDVIRSQLKTILRYPQEAMYYVSPAANLSSRELKVLDCLLKGMTIFDIAKKNRIHYKTVSSHKQSALRKLGIRSLNYLLIGSHRRQVLTRVFQSLPKNNSVMASANER